MATREIKTTIEIDGEQKFKQALSAATREMRVMESELKAVSAAYDVNGNSAEFFAAKQKNIRDQINQQRQIIEALERAVKDAAKTYGEGSSQVDGYAIRLNNARTRMSRLEKELEATDREVEELGRDSIRAGRQLEDGIGEGAENAERSVKDLVQTMQEDISSIRTSTAFSAVSGLWNMATGAFSSVAGFVESTAEYRRQLSFLEQNAQTQGFDFSVIKDQLIEVQGLTGDASSAIEGISNLLAADVNERQMKSAIDNLAGAVISFPDTLKFESLADGLQETIATGSATGQFGELLERLGVDLDEFNAAIEESESTAGDLDIALAYLAANGMADVYEQWKKNNSAMVEAQQTQAALEMELAEFGGTLEKYIVTPVKEKVVEALSWVNDVVKTGEEQGLGAAGEKVKNDVMQATAEGMAAGIAEAAKSEEGRNALITGLDFIASGGIKNPWAWVADKFFGEAEQQKNAGEMAGEAYKTGFEDSFNNWEIEPLIAPTQGSGVNQSGQGGAGRRWGDPAEEWMQVLDQITIDTENAKPALEGAGETVGESLTAGFEGSVEEIETVGEEAGKTAGSAFERGAEGFDSEAWRIGAQIGANYAAGIESQYGRALSASARLNAAATSLWGGSSAKGYAAQAANAAASGAINAVLNIDGKTFARVTAPYLSNALTVRAN